MTSRREWLKLGWFGMCGAALLVIADEPVAQAADRANLKETLVFGLRPRTPAEDAFVDVVVLKVHAGALPLEMVISTFRWAQGRKPYPFPFFERALKQRAAQVGIAL